MSFGWDTKHPRSLLSGVYARESKISHKSALEMCNLSWSPRSNHSCVSPSMGCLEYTQLRTKKPSHTVRKCCPFRNEKHTEVPDCAATFRMKTAKRCYFSGGNFTVSPQNCNAPNTGQRCYFPGGHFTISAPMGQVKWKMERLTYWGVSKCRSYESDNYLIYRINFEFHRNS